MAACWEGGLRLLHTVVVFVRFCYDDDAARSLTRDGGCMRAARLRSAARSLVFT